MNVHTPLKAFANGARRLLTGSGPAATPDFTASLDRADLQDCEVVHVPPFTLPPYLGWLSIFPNFYAVFGAGDCMTPEIESGTILFVDPDHKPNPGEFAVLFIKDRVVLKRYITTDNNGILVGNNNRLAFGHLPADTQMHRVVAWFRPDEAAGLKPDHQD